MVEMAIRTLPLSGAHGGSSSVRLETAPSAERISLRVRAGDVSALSGALGVDLPTKPKTSATANGRTALWLGPDEWLVIGDVGGGLMQAAANSGVLHSATDVSHRNIAILVSGSGCGGSDQCRMPAGSVAERLSGRCLLADDFRQDRDRIAQDRRRRFPCRSLALIFRIRLWPSGRGCSGCGTIRLT